MLLEHQATVAKMAQTELQQAFLVQEIESPDLPPILTDTNSTGSHPQLITATSSSGSEMIVSEIAMQSM